MNSSNSIGSEIHRELIRRFLEKLDSKHRAALGDEQRIRVAFVGGSTKAIELAERTHLAISPIKPVLHIQCESMAHASALELSRKPYCQAAADVGFEWLSFNPSNFIGYALRVRT